jgi:hypothetical protein
MRDIRRTRAGDGRRTAKAVLAHNGVLALKQSITTCGNLKPTLGDTRSADHESRYQRPFEHSLATFARHRESIFRRNSDRLLIAHLVQFITRFDATRRAVVLGRGCRRVARTIMAEGAEAIVRAGASAWSTRGVS